MRYEMIKKSFSLTSEQKELFFEVLESMEFEKADIQIALDLAEKELSMNVLLTTLASFAYYDQDDDFDEEYATSIFQSIELIIRAVQDMDELIDEEGNAIIPPQIDLA